MNYGLPRYYKQWNPTRGVNYFILDRNTGNQVDERNDTSDADTRVKELNDKDRKDRGLEKLDAIEISSTHYGSRNREEIPIEAVPIHK
jgi:hypothetical protein